LYFIGELIVLIGPGGKTKSLRARIVSGSVVLLSGSGLATAVNLGYNVVVARFLGPQGFGHATAVYTLLTLISAVTLSFQIVSTKFVAKQPSAILRDDAYRALHRAAWVCGVLVAAVLLIFQVQISAYLKLPSAILVDFLAVGAAFYVPLGTRRGYIQGAYGFKSLATNLVLEGVVRLAGSVIFIYAGFGINGVIAANAAAMAIAYFAIAPKLVPKEAAVSGIPSAFSEVRQALVFYSGQVLINNSDIVLVKHFFAPEAAGLYAAIAMVGRVTFAFSSAVVNSMFPVVAGSGKDERKNLSLISTALLLVLAIGVLLAVGLRLAPASVWTLFFGSRFAIHGEYGFPYLLSLYAATTVIYSLSVVMITYEMSYKIANTSWVQLAMSGALIASICRYHASLQQVIMVQLVLMLVLLVMVSVPFLVEALRVTDANIDSPRSTVRLIRRISEDEVIAEFLEGDFAHSAYLRYHESLKTIVDSPNLEDAKENAKRRALLFLRHRSLWKELPLDTEWFEAEVRDSDLEQIKVFPRAHWRKLARGNFSITRVMERMRNETAGKDPFVTKITEIRGVFSREITIPGAVVLIGVNESEPLTILDGNHRFLAAAMESRVHQLRVVCGLSPRMVQCCWYKTNLFNLTRYGRNLIRHVVRHPETELKSLFERPS
jgi:O-antigen/teichoic acid export membrane protein